MTELAALLPSIAMLLAVLAVVALLSIAYRKPPGGNR